MLGPEHPATLMSARNLGSVLDKQGKYEEAEAMHRWTLEGSEEVLGQEHPHTLTSSDKLRSVVRRKYEYGDLEIMHCEVEKSSEPAGSRSATLRLPSTVSSKVICDLPKILRTVD